jgi:hypothetical protein
VSSGGSYGASPFEQHIGLGGAEKITSVSITWPSGKQSEAKNLDLNKYYTWNEKDELPKTRNVTAISLQPAVNANDEEHHHHH